MVRSEYDSYVSINPESFVLIGTIRKTSQTHDLLNRLKVLPNSLRSFMVSLICLRTSSSSFLSSRAISKLSIFWF